MSTKQLHILALTILLALPAALAAQQELSRERDDWPKEPRSFKLLEREIELGNVGPVPALGIPSTPRYLVTYMKSRTGGRIRSATAVTVTNQSPLINRVFVSYFKGLSAVPVCVTAFAIPPEHTVDFCSRNVPSPVTTCNSICGGVGGVGGAELTFDEGRAIVSSMWPEIGVSSRVYYTSGANDEEVSAITDSNIVIFGSGNNGD